MTSPLNLYVLLHYAIEPEFDFWNPDDEQESGGDLYGALMWLADEGLLKSRYGDVGWCARGAPRFGPGRDDVERPLFSITDKGRAMVDHLCEVQVPVCKWIKPKAAA
jgi:hypothetical protein